MRELAPLLVKTIRDSLAKYPDLKDDLMKSSARSSAKSGKNGSVDAEGR